MSTNKATVKQSIGTTNVSAINTTNINANESDIMSITSTNVSTFVATFFSTIFSPVFSTDGAAECHSYIHPNIDSIDETYYAAD